MSTDRPALSEEEAKREVIEAAIASWSAFNNVKLDPSNETFIAALATTRTGEALESAIEIAVDLRLKNRRSLSHPTMPATIEVFPESISLDLARGEAGIEYCWLNSNVLVQLGGNQDGSDSVVNDVVNASLDRDEFAYVDGVWLKSGGVVLSTYEGLEECIAAHG